MNTIGVSPAFFVSLYTDCFNMDDILSGLDLVREAGFKTVQLEIYHKEQLDQWNEESIKKLNGKIAEAPLTVSAIIGHYLMHEFSAYENLHHEDLHRKIAGFIDKIKDTAPDAPAVIPVPAMTAMMQQNQPDDVEYRAAILSLRRITSLFSDYGRQIAFEIMPGSILDQLFRDNRKNKYESFFTNINVLFDTRHFYRIEEAGSPSSELFRKNILASHFGDVSPSGSGACLPGTGLIDWEYTLQLIKSSGYKGSIDIDIDLDIDIKTGEPQTIIDEYKKGKAFILEKLTQIKEKI